MTTNVPNKPNGATAKTNKAATQIEPQAAGKIGVILTLLRKPKGASIPDLMEATGWQAHSVRGALSGTIKKKLGLEVLSAREGATRFYRLGA